MARTDRAWETDWVVCINQLTSQGPLNGIDVFSGTWPPAIEMEVRMDHAVDSSASAACLCVLLPSPVVRVCPSGPQLHPLLSFSGVSACRSALAGEAQQLQQDGVVGVCLTFMQVYCGVNSYLKFETFDVCSV